MSKARTRAVQHITVYTRKTFLVYFPLDVSFQLLLVKNSPEAILLCVDRILQTDRSHQPDRSSRRAHFQERFKASGGTSQRRILQVFPYLLCNRLQYWLDYLRMEHWHLIMDFLSRRTTQLCLKAHEFLSDAPRSIWLPNTVLVDDVPSPPYSGMSRI